MLSNGFFLEPFLENFIRGENFFSKLEKVSIFDSFLDISILSMLLPMLPVQAEKTCPRACLR